MSALRSAWSGASLKQSPVRPEARRRPTCGESWPRRSSGRGPGSRSRQCDARVVIDDYGFPTKSCRRSPFPQRPGGASRDWLESDASCRTIRSTTPQFPSRKYIWLKHSKRFGRPADSVARIAAAGVKSAGASVGRCAGGCPRASPADSASAFVIVAGPGRGSGGARGSLYNNLLNGGEAESATCFLPVRGDRLRWGPRCKVRARLQRLIG